MTDSIKYKTKTSEKSGQEADYIIIDNLPTHFRQYTFDKAYVRGLYFSEAKSLSKIVDSYGKNIPMEKLAQVYEDVIILEDSSIYDLELCDFFALQTISTLNTLEGFGWIPNQPCRQYVEGKMCEGEIIENITLSDFDFSDPIATTLPLPFKFKDKDIFLGAVTIRDLIYLEGLPEEDKVYANYACMWKDEGLPIKDKINLIKYCSPSEGESFVEMDKSLYIGIKTFNKKCSTCHKESEVRIGLNTIKSFP